MICGHGDGSFPLIIGLMNEIEKTLPGCVVTGSTCEEAGRNMHEAVEFHVAGLREEAAGE